MSIVQSENAVRLAEKHGGTLVANQIIIGRIDLAALIAYVREEAMNQAIKACSDANRALINGGVV
jgi:hypothetical protein